MKASLLCLRMFFCISATFLCVAFFSSPPLLGNVKARPISSLTAEERARLPDNTQVTLESGKTVSLGTLRAEHRARLERFSRAAALGKIAAGKLSPHPAPRTQISSTGAGKAGSSAPPGKAVGGRTAQVSPNISLPPALVPFQFSASKNSGFPVPRDYLDFCQAANASACIYQPANATFKKIVRPEEHKSSALEQDFLIDRAICEFDGGQFGAADPASPAARDVCNFFYPMEQTTSFKPTGPLDTSTVCDPPAKYIVDPKGAVQVSIETAVSTGPTPVSCIVQVWIGSK